MTDWKDEITGYHIPETAVLIEGGSFGGFHWVKLESAEDMAMALSRMSHVNIAAMVRRGAIKVPGDDETAGYVVLLDHRGHQHLFGFFDGKGLNYTHGMLSNSRTPEAREDYSEAISVICMDGFEWPAQERLSQTTSRSFT